MEDDVPEYLMYCRPDKRPSNLINHISDIDGTKRSEQACYIIENYNPQSAEELAIILDGNKQWTIAENKKHNRYPMFYDDKKLVEFCKRIAEENNYGPGFIDHCVTQVDDVDIAADIWRLSPAIRMRYPTITTWEEAFKNSRIMLGFGGEPYEGWHTFKKDVDKASYKLRRAIKNSINVDLNKKF